MFSAIALGFAGVWAFFEGILAISSSKIYVANATYVFSNLHTWGWIMMILGVLTVLAAFAVFAGSELARWYGIAIAGINAWGQLMFLHAQPWWERLHVRSRRSRDLWARGLRRTQTPRRLSNS